jgi:hypothetical protein
MQDLSLLTIRYQAVPDASAQEPDPVAGQLLQAGLARSLADGVYLYRLDRDHVFLDLVSFRGLPATLTQSFQAQTGERTRNWLFSTDNQPTRVATSAWKDWRLERLPEFVQNRFETAIAIPLLTEGRLGGLLTAARLAGNGFTLQEASSLLALRAPLENLLAAGASREENGRLKSELQKVSERLASRKHIERAKGIIQTRHGWTEEEAYLHLWRLSRKTRKPMGEIARSVIVHSTPGLSPRVS